MYEPQDDVIDCFSLYQGSTMFCVPKSYSSILSLYLCCSCLLICQTSGPREFAASRSQVKKYQRDFWWVNTVGLQKGPAINKTSMWEGSTEGFLSWIEERERGKNAPKNASTGYCRHDKEVTEPWSHLWHKPSSVDIMGWINHFTIYDWGPIVVTKELKG